MTKQNKRTVQPFNRSTIQRAFTLAEVLIVIGIIGVVAALTLPNLNHATGDKEKVTRVKKAYSVLAEALDRAQAIYGNFDTWFKDLPDSENVEARSERFANRISEFLKVSRKCDYEDENCFSYSGSTEGQYSEGYSIIMPDGMSVLFNVSDFGGDNLNNTIMVDIDGPNKGKNQDGNDVFAFDIYDNTLYPGMHRRADQFVERWVSTDDLLSSCLGQNYCTDWVIQFGNLDYLKTSEVREGKQSTYLCPNGTQLSATQTSCN